MQSSFILKRIHAQVYNFVRQARASGVEKDWIALISGRRVEPQNLLKLDALVTSILEGPLKIPTRIPDRAYAYVEPDSFTNRNILRYEIPKSVRIELQKQALSQTNDVEKAKKIYLELKLKLRSDLLRKHAVAQTQRTIPPLKVEIDPNSPFRQITESSNRENLSLDDLDLHFPQDAEFHKAIRQINRDAQAEGIEPSLKEMTSGIKTFPNRTAMFESLEYKWDVPKSHPLTRPLVDVLEPYDNVSRRAYFPFNAKPPTNLPITRFFNATLEKMYNRHVKHLPQYKKHAIALRAYQKKNEEDLLNLANLTDEDIFERFPEWKEYAKKRMLQHKWKIDPTPGVDDQY